MADDPMFTHYPEVDPAQLSATARQAYVEALVPLEQFVIELRDELAARAKPRNLSHNSEMRREFLFWIAQVVRRHAPDLDAQRSYTGIDDGSGSGWGLRRFFHLRISSNGWRPRRR